MNNIFRLSLHNSWDSNKGIIIKRHSLTLSWLLGLCVAHINVTYLWTYYHCWYKFKFIIFPLLSSLYCLLIKLNYYHSLSNAEVVKACSTLWSITVYILLYSHSSYCKSKSDDTMVLFFANKQRRCVHFIPLQERVQLYCVAFLQVITICACLYMLDKFKIIVTIGVSTFFSCLTPLLWLYCRTTAKAMLWGDFPQKCN